MLIRWRDGAAQAAEDPFSFVADDQDLPQGEALVSLGRLQRDGEWMLARGSRRLGVRLAPADPVEALAPWLDRLAVVELEFARFRDGRPYSAARVLRERMGYAGELRAVGDVLREQAFLMVRCGFDAFKPADGSSAEQWTAAASRFRHVYQRAADARPPAFVEREAL